MGPDSVLSKEEEITIANWCINLAKSNIAMTNIILYALPPNATHMMQPADVSVFKPLKSEWKNTVHDWAIQPKNINSTLTKSKFCPLLQRTLNKENLATTIKNGFRKCGLFPYNPNVVDYSKCTQNNIEKLKEKSDIATDKDEFLKDTSSFNPFIESSPIPEINNENQSMTSLPDLGNSTLANNIFYDTNEIPLGTFEITENSVLVPVN
ncbi:hypothetical protein NQ314_005019, partial [Rhamnusium bicolor]